MCQNHFCINRCLMDSDLLEILRSREHSRLTLQHPGIISWKHWSTLLQSVVSRTGMQTPCSRPKSLMKRLWWLFQTTWRNTKSLAIVSSWMQWPASLIQWVLSLVQCKLEYLDSIVLLDNGIILERAPRLILYRKNLDGLRGIRERPSNRYEEIQTMTLRHWLCKSGTSF